MKLQGTKLQEVIDNIEGAIVIDKNIAPFSTWVSFEWRGITYTGFETDDMIVMNGPRGSAIKTKDDFRSHGAFPFTIKMEMCKLFQEP